MEITKKAKFITDVYGGKAFLPGDEIVKNWLQDMGDKLNNPRLRELNKAKESDQKLAQILNVFNTNGNNEPVIGNWMLLRCSINAHKIAGCWNKFQVSADMWRNSVEFSPIHVGISRNGKILENAEFVEAYTVSLKDRSFFTAYQGIRKGAEIGFTLVVADDLCVVPEGRGKDKIFKPDPGKTKTCAEAVLERMQTIGLGGFRERFGKFEYV